MMSKNLMEFYWAGCRHNPEFPESGKYKVATWWSKNPVSNYEKIMLQPCWMKLIYTFAVA